MIVSEKIDMQSLSKLEFERERSALSSEIQLCQYETKITLMYNKSVRFMRGQY